MELRYQAGRSIRHVAGAMTEAALVVAIAVALVFGVAVAGGSDPAGAGDVSAAGKLTASISLGAGLRSSAMPGGSSVSFEVKRSVPDNDPVMWVTNKCYDESGSLVSVHDRAVEWGTSASLAGSAGPFTASGVECKAYATLKPWRSTVLGDAVIFYSVGG